MITVRYPVPANDPGWDDQLTELEEAWGRDEPTDVAGLAHLDRLAVTVAITQPRKRERHWQGALGWIGIAIIVAALAAVLSY